MSQKVYINKVRPARSPHHYEFLVLGDVHLGLSICRIQALIEFITRKVSFNTLVFQGDTFNHHGLRTLPKLHQEFLDTVRKLEKDGVTVLWGKGNHDHNLAELLDRFYRPGCEIQDEHRFAVADRKFLVMHGHRFDNFITDSPRLTDIATLIYEAIAKVEPDEWWSLAGALKHLAKENLLQVTRILRQEALLAASVAGCNVVILGHTHHIEHARSGTKGDWIHYLNAGCWTQRRCGAVGIDHAGKTHLLRVRVWQNPH